jgi:hypothetical protein
MRKRSLQSYTKREAAHQQNGFGSLSFGGIRGHHGLVEYVVREAMIEGGATANLLHQESSNEREIEQLRQQIYLLIAKLMMQGPCLKRRILSFPDPLTSDDAEEFQYLIDDAGKREAEKAKNAAAEAAHETELVAIFGPEGLLPFSGRRIRVEPPKEAAIVQREEQVVVEQRQNVARVAQDPEEETDNDEAGSTIVVSPLKPIRKRNRAIISTVGSSVPPPSFKMSLRSRN